jgi:hypothetical protein
MHSLRYMIASIGWLLIGCVDGMTCLLNQLEDL